MRAFGKPQASPRRQTIARPGAAVALLNSGCAGGERCGVGRVGRAADWLLWAGLGAGLGLYFGLAALRGSTHTLRWDQWADGVRLGALALASACPGMLLLGWTGRHLASVRKNRAAKREIRRAVLLKHADPLSARVDEHAGRLDRHDAMFRAYDRRITALVTALSDRLADAGVSVPDREQTAPMLRIVGGKRDSA